jgi:hypothetical protein
MADLFGGVVIGIPGRTAAFSVLVDGRASLGSQMSYAASDQNTISALANKLTACNNSLANCGAALTAVNNQSTGGQLNSSTLQSQLLVRGILFKDIGLAAAHHFDFLDGVDLGITPKFSQVTTYDYAANAQSSSISLNQGEKKYSVFNIDLGASKVFKTEGGDEIKAGVVAKNLMSKDLKTVLNNSINIKPQATVGATYVTKLTTIGADLDLIKNSPLISGFSKESQYLRVGAEFDAWRWAQIRLGYRHDLKGNYPGLPSVGLGLSPFGLHVELSAAYANGKEAAFSLQSGFRF